MFFCIGSVCYTREGLFRVTINVHHPGRPVALLHHQAFCFVLSSRGGGSRRRCKDWVGHTSYIRFHDTVVTRIIFIAAMFTTAAPRRLWLCTCRSLSLQRKRTRSFTVRMRCTQGTNHVYLWTALALKWAAAPYASAPSLAFACTSRVIDDAIALPPLRRPQLELRTLIVRFPCFEKSRVVLRAPCGQTRADRCFASAEGRRAVLGFWPPDAIVITVPSLRSMQPCDMYRVRGRTLLAGGMRASGLPSASVSISIAGQTVELAGGLLPCSGGVCLVCQKTSHASPSGTKNDYA
jgi:hypothetical protein